MIGLVRQLEKIATLAAVLTFLHFQLVAQSTGGRNGLSFLNLPPQATNASLGAYQATIKGNDPALFFQNPSLLDSTKDDRLSISYMPYLASTHFLTTAFAHTLKNNSGTVSAGIQYFNYGSLQQTDDLGNSTGEFQAADYSVAVGYGHTISHITFGGSIKFVGSGIENYQLWGLAMDWGGVFKHPVHDLTAGLVVKNIGFLKKNYGGGDTPPLPFDVRAGITFKPTYMPARFAITAHHLYRFDMVYNNPDLFFDYDANGNRVPKKIGVAEKLLRHLTVGVELLLHKKFHLLFGYDHLLRQEMKLQNVGGIQGASVGAWLSVNRFDFSYGYRQFTPGSGSSTFSLTMNLQK